MVVKVVDPVPDASVLKYRICYNCGIKLSYVPNDIKERVDTDWTGSSETVKFIVCPNCSKELTCNR